MSDTRGALLSTIAGTLSTNGSGTLEFRREVVEIIDRMMPSSGDESQSTYCNFVLHTLPEPVQQAIIDAYQTYLKESSVGMSDVGAYRMRTTEDNRVQNKISTDIPYLIYLHESTLSPEESAYISSDDPYVYSLRHK